MKNIQIKGIHSATELREDRAGSKISSAKRRMSHTKSATVGGILLIRLHLTEYHATPAKPERHPLMNDLVGDNGIGAAIDSRVCEI